MATLAFNAAGPRSFTRALLQDCLPPASYLAAGAIGATLAILLAGAWDDGRAGSRALSDALASRQSIMQRVPWSEQVVRTGKADRLATPKAASGGLPLAAVEVVGVENVSLLFRSRFGQVVFQTEPLTATTYIAKDLAWPPFVIRPKSASPVELRFPEPGTTPARRPAGCEPVTSDVADPGRTGVIGRCIALASRTG